MLLTKSKIYEIKLITEDLSDKNFNCIFLDCKKYECWHWGSFQVVVLNYLKTLGFFIWKGANSWDKLSEFAAETGNEKLVQIFMSKDETYDWKRLMLYSCKGYQPSIIDLCISKIKDRSYHRWQTGINYAAQEGCINIVQFFITKGLKSYNIISWGAAEEYARDEGHFALSEYFRKIRKSVKKSKKHISRKK